MPPGMPKPVGLIGEADALLILDRHRDFLPDWAMPVPWGGQLRAQIAGCARRFLQSGQPVIWSGDVHLPVGMRLIDWPAVQRFPADLDTKSALDQVWLTESLRRAGVTRIFLCGLALEHDWLWISRDALGQGFELVLVTDALVALDAQPGEVPRAMTVADREGAQLVKLHEIVRPARAHIAVGPASSFHALA